MEEKLQGVVLNSVNYGENDKILSVFTLEKGIISAKIKGVKKAGAKLKFASEPFCFAEFIVLSSADKKSVINASLIDSFYPIREDIKRYFAGGSVLEFIKKFAKDSIVSANAFTLLITALKELAYSDENPESVLTRFFINALSVVGYGLNISANCPKCGKPLDIKPFFEYNIGAFRCEDCKADNGAREINFLTLSAMNKAKKGEPITEREGVFCLRLIDYFLKQKIETEIISLKELIR
ncbi:MAG: DNA repair protein RecO [Clostridia bacterium]|nr:DNA repair protein RecO [Clostridia bacterium]